MLEDVGVAAYKIPSGEVNNIPLLEYIGRRPSRSPVFGNEQLARAGCSHGGAGRRACNPAAVHIRLSLPSWQVGLNVMQAMSERYKVPVGYSDHTMGFAAPIAAVALGASVIEKHFAFSRLMYGSDAKHSMEPDDFRRLCRELKDAGRMLQSPVDKDDLSSVSDMKLIFEKSIVAAVDLPASTEIAMHHLAFKKPGDGIPAARYQDFIGRRIIHSVPRNHKFATEDFV